MRYFLAAFSSAFIVKRKRIAMEGLQGKGQGARGKAV